MKPWWGLDTERDAKTGEFVCGWISNEDESHPFRTFEDLAVGVYWVWNVGYDIEGMVRDVGKDEGWAMREDATPFMLGDAKCVYFKDKRFEWKSPTGRRIFLESSGFYNRIALKEAAKALCVCKCESCKGHKKDPKRIQHCGAEPQCPMKDPVDASKMSLSRYERDRRYREEIDRYCAKDARIAFRLMTFLERGFADLGVKMNGHPIHIGGTPGGTARRLMRNVPPFPRVIWTTHRQFLEAYCGGRFEIVKRGVFGPSTQYDLVSAYPWALSKCPMLSANATHSFTRRLSDNALYGAYEVEFKTDEYLGVMPSWRGGTRVYSKAEKRGWMCRPELEWLQKRGHDYKIHRGVEIFDESPTDGWRQLVEPIFGVKESFKGQPLGLGAKVGVNSLYGILIQLIQKGGVWVPIEEAENPVDFAGFLALEKGPKAFEAGQFYAPCYSSTLTSMVRCRVLDATIEVGEQNAVASHTDSLLATGGTLKTGDGLGDWKFEKSADELIILKSGQYALGESVKGRGFSKRKLNPLDEDEVAVRQKIDLWAQQHTRRSRTSVRTAGGDWKRVSLIGDKQVANNVQWEVKRKWARGFDVRMIQRREWIDSEALALVNPE